MKYLSPQIAQLTKNKPKKTLINKGTSCGIFQDLGSNPEKQVYQKRHS